MNKKRRRGGGGEGAPSSVGCRGRGVEIMWRNLGTNIRLRQVMGKASL
jgi:hypothetical protein